MKNRKQVLILGNVARLTMGLTGSKFEQGRRFIVNYSFQVHKESR